MHFFDMCRTERRRLFNISICGKTILIAVCVLAMGVLTFINENPNIEMTDKYFYELFRLYFSRGTFFQLLFVPVGYYIMYGICTDLKEKMLSSNRYASFEQARIITRVYQENEKLSLPKKRALSL